ncbi:MAG TPA: chromosome segregation protein SMC [Gammaproteobacteria bacterium]|nr:chromosome segregation protein SMC [Gammaproteobacteria bacterium]
MRLSKIKLSGFKSFVDATTITFPSNLMGIVGPNGCGKSNIIDAIRWVLGESSAKTLRGDSMADVIFNGSSGRKPVSQASIELVFDNSDGTVSGPYAQYSEISVRRVLSRDGTSLYFLNGGRCRRKDITHILLGTGLGTNGYSIIEQGMISRVVEAKPDELRGFLEEAAGISKYKERRRETEHRIRHTRENLERLGDLRDEIEKQLAHLKRQASAATRYKELKSEQRKVHAELLALRLKSLRAELGAHEAALAEKQNALEAALAAQRTLESDTEGLRAALAERHETLNGVQGEYYRVGAEIARLEQSIQHRKDLIKRQREDLETTEQQLEEIRAHIANDQLELEQLDHALEELSPELDQAVADRQASEDLLAQAEGSMERWRERWEQVSRDFSNSEGAARVEEARLEQLAAQRDRVLREIEKQSAERGTLDAAEPAARLEQLVAEEETLKAACEDAARRLDGVWHQIQELREQDRRISAHLHQLREELQNDRGRLASLEALQEAAIGQTTQQVSRWLEHAPLADRRNLGERLVVDAGWDRAVETVLGSYLQAVSVDAIEAVSETLGELSEGGLALIEEVEHPAPGEVLGGWLADHVKEPAAARALLAGVRTADFLGAAIAMRSRLAATESVVTRDGFWVGRNWLRINRSDDPEVGVIARGEEITRLRGKIESTSALVEDVAKELGDTRIRVEQLEEARKSAQGESTQRQQLHTEARAKLEAARSELEQIRSRAAALDRSLEELQAEQRAVEEKLEQSRRSREEAALRLEELGELRARLEEERDQLHGVLSETRAQAEHDRQAAHDLALKVENRRHSKESASAALARVEAQQQHLLKRRDELRSRLEGAADPLSEDEGKLAALAQERAEVEARLTEARRAAEQTEEQLRELEQRRTHAHRAVGEAREAADAVRLVVREAEVRAETVAEQFRETGFELEQIMTALPENASTEVWHETLERLERRIQRLGPINLAAIDEFQQQSERKTYLDAQYADLTEALETLENAIRKIDKETRSRFKDTFDRANLGLQRLFPRLFGGGHAYLELEGEDLLESGVTVMARPPGKRNSTIHLLSGGEKALTAVALVFSIFELNPAPFCLLDEVDAPLDDANVGRFSDIVREMSQQVQFVIITHNKTTMETMHQLTGVTMNEPGVSRLVAVDLDEAVKLAAM